jgi:hypothetical protein
MKTRRGTRRTRRSRRRSTRKRRRSDYLYAHSHKTTN